MDVIYMENTECFEIINRLSVRIAKDESDQLKGSEGSNPWGCTD